jgi:hypothetical protein
MGPHFMEDLAGVLAVFFGGAIILTPVVAISARLALRPLIESFARLKHGSEADHTQDRRLALLEAEMQNLQGTLQSLAEAEEFRRQLAGRTD